ncbi:MAG: DNA methyltransferase, partial [Chloroflexia bacterium]
RGADLQGKVILDPFMGGGTTIVEALRLNCRVIGMDINPVAWFVTKKEIEPIDLDVLDAAFAELERTAGEEIRRYYRTTRPGGHEAEVMYYFWVKVAECAHCGARTRLFPNYELSRRDHVNVSCCRDCPQIVETYGYDPATVCPECGRTFDPRKGVSGRGVFRCAVCGREQRLLEAVKRRGAALDLELHALEGYCQTCGRFFKRVDADDLERWNKARLESERRQGSLLIPREAIPTEGRSDPRPVNHGYTHYYQMFNERQLLCLSILLEHILRLPDPNAREMLLLAFSDCLDANNMFCKYEVAWHKISLFFGLHAYHPIERPAENNVWGTAFGRGTFVKCFEKVRRGKAYCLRPYRPSGNVISPGSRYGLRPTRPGGSMHRRTTFAAGERIEGHLVADFAELERMERAALLRCQSAEDLSFIPDRSIDAVVTDPPYFDNVQYSEPADFFYVWLRLGLKEAYPWFAPPSSARPEEIVKNDKSGKTTDFFSRGLRRVLAECRRVLKDDGLLIFTFHHNQVWAWQEVAQLLLETGFYISATPIVRSEGKSGFHSSKGNIRYDAVLVCRKIEGKAKDEGQTERDLGERILSDAVFWVKRTLDSGMAVNDVDVFAVVMAKAIEWYTKAATDSRCSLSLEDLLRDRAGLVAQVRESALSGQTRPSGPYAAEVKQLALFVMESRERYEPSPLP